MIYNSKLLKNILPVLVVMLSMILSISCKRENTNDCYTNTGEDVVETRQLEFFDEIELYNNVNLVIEQGESNEIRVEGGRNILPSIQTTVVDGKLVIRNNMKCNWVRDYNSEITIHVSCNYLDSLRYEGSGDVISQGQVKFDSLAINVWGGSGVIKMDVKCINLKLALHYGSVDFKFSGTSSITTIYANSYGPFYCNDLDSDIIYIRNSGTNDCYVHVNDTLEADITSVGNIYYTGNPFFTRSGRGSGRLIKND